MGTIRIGQKLVLMPTRLPVEVQAIEVDEADAERALPGDNLRVRLKSLEEDDVHPGFVLCDTATPCNVAKEFDVTLSILECKSIMTAGYSAVLHVHSIVTECTIEVHTISVFILFAVCCVCVCSYLTCAFPAETVRRG